MTYDEAIAKLEMHGATGVGATLQTAIDRNHPALLEDFSATDDKPQPHFQTVGPQGGVLYLRLAHRGPKKIVFGSAI